MRLYNIQQHSEQVTFTQALLQGLGKNQGLFFPEDLPKFSIFEINSLLEMSFIERSTHILSKYIGPELSKNSILTCVKNAFNFPAPLVCINNNIAVLELFHGPTLAFKDFGSRLMAQMLNQTNHHFDKPMVILTATSGDTGAAVAHAFFNLSNIHVIILYPRGKISVLQEKLFCTLGGNVSTISVHGDFDSCQRLVKQAFDDSVLRTTLDLNSANSINIGRLLAQICYYFEGVSQLPHQMRNKLVIAVPSGNFGNLTAGLLAQSSGLPVKKFIAATNINDTVPRFLEYGYWEPRPTVSTFSNAMDVSSPNNWSRIEELFRRENKSIKELEYGCVNDLLTEKTVQEIADLGYLSEPHTAVAYRLLCDKLHSDEFGICLGTAHPVKFKELVENFLKKKIQVILPVVLKERMKLPILSYEISKCFSSLRNLILKIIS
ncbi:threonine synthase [Blochmannia endosymbiont of Camponotus sp.]|uniref:threonine synthase n=1 Tax=Blochmannia endosymbiont of Camponotus sp. TaxID=700220 RepID=UPI0020242E61|nr:threonine synthase [Blochmannia endosymbiont of Camponotus sp.]URJ24035.1 threonine synthase [Blochmannia endosymbiont of Camponotus sp.]